MRAARTVHFVGREVWRSGFRTFRKHRRPCGQPAVLGEIARFRPVPPQAGHLIWINAMPSVLPFSSTGFATYPEPPHFGQSPGATPLPLTVEPIFYEIGRNRPKHCFALRNPNKVPEDYPVRRLESRSRISRNPRRMFWISGVEVDGNGIALCVLSDFVSARSCCRAPEIVNPWS